MIVHVHLTFNGNCREAMQFYQKCLGGQLSFQTVGESSLSDTMPKKMKESIVHATLSNAGILLMGSDMVPEPGLVKGNSVSLSIGCKSEDEVKNLYNRLSSGGTANHPPDETFWGGLFGALTDKFGNHWLLNYAKN